MKSKPTPPPPLRTLSDLTSDPRNANRGTARGREALADSLRAYGAGRAVLVDRHSVVIAGNKTVEEAKVQGLGLRMIESNGAELVAVRRSDLDLASDARAQALAIVDNRVSELGLEWDEAVLRDLDEAGVDLSNFWSDDEFAALLATPTAGLIDENAAITPGPTSFVRGDLVVLGRHRLLCGDATSGEDVERLLDGATPLLMITDPPYGVDYDPGWRHQVYPGQRTAVGRVANDDRPNWTEAWQYFKGDVAYVWHAGLHAGTVAASLDAAEFDVRSQIVWVKPHFVLSRGHYHWQHEVAWYAVRRGATAHWCGDRRQSTVWEVPGLNPIGQTGSPENTVTGHATQKPIKLFEIPILNHTQRGETIFEPFSGSGSAIVAAEKTGRTCLALEIDPRYVQVAVSRWEAFTGQSATVVGGGR